MTREIDFGDAFEELTGNPPFKWQRRLFEEWLSVGKLPLAVDIPTGLGKTAVMAVWLLARATGARSPRRLVYVVDRRAVVDQATRFAEQLRARMSGGLAAMLGLGEGSDVLPISTLRGGFADNRDWLEDPVKPAIIVGTIDMIGSRLLFEGYGVSRGMRPYQAGFLGVDTLVLLDEAHLCPPFEALLRQVADHRDGRLGAASANGSGTPPFNLVSLSATGRKMANVLPESVFGLTDRDREEPVVRQRLTARKRLKVTNLTEPEALVETMAGRAIELGFGDSPSRVVVYCNSRRDAVEIKTSIDKEIKRRQKSEGLSADCGSELLVGERRVYERAQLETWLDLKGFLGGSTTAPQFPAFLVATSAGEVGVDLDADHMVCDLVAYERMVQRLGRVNRRGGDGRISTVDVFATRPELKANARKAEKEEHQKNLETYDFRMAPLIELPIGEDGRRDASPSATAALKRDHSDVVDAATTPAPLYPELTRPLVDAWAMTSLKEHEGRPEVAPWLRGWEDDDEPQTVVVWRRYLPCLSREDSVSVLPKTAVEFFGSAPVHATERLEAPSKRVFDWLLKRAVQVGKREDGHELSAKDSAIAAILVDRAGEHKADVTFGYLRDLAAPAGSLTTGEKRDRDRAKRDWMRRLPGCLLVVDARVGGLRDGMLDEKCDLKAVAADADEDWRATKEDGASEASRPVIRFRVEEVSAGDEEEGLAVAAEIEDWRHVRTFETRLGAAGVASGGLAVYKWPDEVADEESRSILSAPQSLAHHAEQAEARVRHLATELELPEEEIEALAVAARLHDDGKASIRWQNAMNAPKDGRPYAKTSGGGNWRLLDGYRHEFGSLIKAEEKDLPESTRDLVLHLIAAHHGNARPLITPSGCDDGPPSKLTVRAGEAALRFARLQKKYGPWGLAWREALLRAADQSVSREWSRQHRKRANG